jgi:hypothetical protein
MTAGSQRAALDAIHSARPIIARLSMARDSEDLAADLIEAWTATETGLRSLIGGSALTGQMLIRELRQRHFLSLEQANALAEFHAARRFYLRAVQADTTDRPAQGFLGCSLVRLGRIDEGVRWINRAGAGAWSSCTPPPGSVAQPGMQSGVPNTQPGMQAVPPAGSLPPATGQPYPR